MRHVSFRMKINHNICDDFKKNCNKFVKFYKNRQLYDSLTCISVSIRFGDIFVGSKKDNFLTIGHLNPHCAVGIRTCAQSKISASFVETYFVQLLV